jgi:hypothetical protein
MKSTETGSVVIAPPRLRNSDVAGDSVGAGPGHDRAPHTMLLPIDRLTTGHPALAEPETSAGVTTPARDNLPDSTVILPPSLGTGRAANSHKNG